MALVWYRSSPVFLGGKRLAQLWISGQPVPYHLVVLLA